VDGVAGGKPAVPSLVLLAVVSGLSPVAMAIVLPHGALFRGGAEGQIRQYIIEKQNSLDAVIGLPANLFYGTGIPAIVLVFRKCRRQDQDILLA